MEMGRPSCCHDVSGSNVFEVERGREARKKMREETEKSEVRKKT